MKTNEISIDNMPSTIMAKKFKKFMGFVKQVLFIVMLVLTFYVSQKLAVIIDTTSIETLKQVINVILAVVVVIIYTKK